MTTDAHSSLRKRVGILEEIFESSVLTFCIVTTEVL